MASTKRAVSRFLLLLILLELPCSALAQSVIPCDRHPDCGRELAVAQQKFAQGELEPALFAIQELFDKYQDPRLLYSIARLFHRLNRYAEAISAYRRYLDSGAESDAQLLDKARRQLAEAEASLQALQPDFGADQQIRSDRPSDGLSEKLEEKPLLGRAETGVALTSAGNHRATGRPVYKRAWFWIVLGGAAAAIVGVGVGIGWTSATAPPSGTRDLRWISIPPMQ